MTEEPIDYTTMNSGELDTALGMNAALWAKAFIQHKVEAESENREFVSEDNMVGWFANAIMSGFDAARDRYEAANQVKSEG